MIRIQIRLLPKRFILIIVRLRSSIRPSVEQLTRWGVLIKSDEIQPPPAQCGASTHRHTQILPLTIPKKPHQEQTAQQEHRRPVPTFGSIWWPLFGLINSKKQCIISCLVNEYGNMLHGDAHNSLGLAAEDYCFLKGSVPLRNTIILPSRTHFPNADGKVAQFFFFFSGEPWKASCVGLFDVWFGLLFSSKP